MGNYLFERCTEDGAGRDASGSLREDVAAALGEIDWVENFALRADGDDEGVVGADVTFDEQWPDVRTSNPDQVTEVFHRLGLRTIANPAVSTGRVSADDPLGTSSIGDGDALGLFEFDEEIPLDLTGN